VGLTGLVSLLWFGAEGAARTLLTVSLALVGVVGMGRLCGRMGLRGPGRYLAGLVLLAGPGTAALVGRGSWLALAAAAVLPWSVRAAFLHPRDLTSSRLWHIGWALLFGLLTAAFSPLLAIVPLITVGVWRALGGDRANYLLAGVCLAGGLAGAAFLIGDPAWVTDPALRLDVAISDWWPAVIVVASLPLVLAAPRLRLVGLTGGLLSLSALVVARIVSPPPGVQEAVLIVASFGAALVVASALDGLSRNVLRVVASLGAIALLVMSASTFLNGRLGLPGGDVNERLAFAVTLADGPDPGRILYASAERNLVPGEARPGPGFWYRVVDGAGTTHDEVWLPPDHTGDLELARTLTDVASGAELRPGASLGEFAIEWVVLEGPSFVLDDALLAQLDLVRTPLDPESRVFDNRNSVPLAGTEAAPWTRQGTGFAGFGSGSPVPLAVEYDEGWEPDAVDNGWSTLVSGDEGRAYYSAGVAQVLPPIVTSLALAGAGAMIGLGRRRK
jgi:hypothetical protein